MKKLISFIILSVLLLFILNIKVEIKADNGVPYDTFTYNHSQGSMVRTQDAYIPLSNIKSISGYTLNSPQDIIIDKNDNVFIADTKNKRIIRFNLTNNDDVMIIGEGLLQEPTGLAVDEENNLYIADFALEAAYKYTFDAINDSYSLEVSYQKPNNSPLFLESDVFKPSKILVDKGKNVYIVLAGNINGLAQYNNTGEFYGYFGGNQIPATFQNILKNLLFNEEQRRSWFKMIPKSVFNATVDKKGSILTITKTMEGYKKINVGNTVLQDGNVGSNMNEDIAIGPINNVFTVTEDGYIVEYSANGEFLFVFGGKDEYSQKGLFVKPSAISVDSKNNLYVLDSETNNLQVFYPTAFANTVHMALDLYQNGRYIESEALWNEVIKMNSLFDLAHRGLGSSYFARGEYQKAMESFRLARDQQGYSDAYWEVRNLSLLNGRFLIFIALFFIGLYLIKYPIRFINSKMKKYRLYRELTYGFVLLRHPIHAYYGIKKQNKTSFLSATVILFVFYGLYLLSLYKTGFLFNDVILAKVNLMEETTKIFVPFITWIIANYLVCSIREGEGKLKHVYQASAYMLMPMIVILPIVTLLSNYLTFNESFLYEFLMFVGIAVTGIYVILMVKEIHNYNVSSSVINILISIFTALMIVVVVFIVYILTSEIFKFFNDIWMEVMSRG